MLALAAFVAYLAVDYYIQPITNVPAVATNDAAPEVPDEFVSQVSDANKTAAIEPESNVEIVYGMSVRKDRNCTIEQHYIARDDGTVSEAYSCRPNNPPPPGPFDTLGDQTLMVMAYSDPAAAEELGMRWAEDYPEEARAMMLRSVALQPNNTLPLRWLVTQNYSQTEENGKPAITAMKENYLLERVAEELGTPGVATNIQIRLTSAGLQEEDFLALETSVKADLMVIRSIQLEITGHSDLAEMPL